MGGIAASPRRDGRQHVLRDGGRRVVFHLIDGWGEAPAGPTAASCAPETRRCPVCSRRGEATPAPRAACPARRRMDGHRNGLRSRSNTL
jgi:hypothetical protein